ncbi:MAG TPA: maleylpyruvate isomerase N-terminal domain-containing protein [Acidimicrobiales bacterium]|nr:maleylpyruvate isomerase N-terminal domain-containing protein [Acidimicrobiales bacterium]
MDRTTHHTRNVAGLVAQRQALLAFLADLSPEAWDREVPGAGGATVKDVVAHLAERYAEALSGTLPPGDQGASDADVPSPAGRGAGDDPAGLLVELDQYATELESHFAERAGERWSLPAVAFGKLGGTSGMGVAGLLLDLHRHIHQISQAVGARVPVPEESRDATAAALAWLVGDKVEAPVQVVLEDGADYVIGSGPSVGVLRTDHDALVAVATGMARPEDMAAEGRWSFTGPRDGREAFEHALATTFGDPEL